MVFPPGSDPAAEVRRLLVDGDASAAVTAAARLLDATPAGPGRAGPAALLALAFLRDGDPASAERLVPGADLPVTADSASLLAGLVALRLAADDLDGAEAHGRRLIDQLARLEASRAGRAPVPDPAVLDALADLVDALTRRGRATQAIPLQQAAIELLAEARTAEARRRRSALWVGLAQNLTRLGRADIVRRIGERAFATFAADPDRETRQNALVAGCMGAQAALAQGAADDAFELAERIAAHIPDDDPQTPELQGRVGLVVAAAQLELHGSEVAERTYRRVVRALEPSTDPGARLFLALALEMLAAMPGEIDRLEDAAEAGRELAAVVDAFPPGHPDLAAVAECANRAAERLIPFGAPDVAADLAGAVTRRRANLLDGTDAIVCLRAYIFRLDALRLLGDGERLQNAWQEVLELGAPALEVLDGLAARYRQHGLRAAQAYTELGRVAVLARLGREDDARRHVERILIEFGADDDDEVRSILARLRPAEPDEDD